LTVDDDDDEKGSCYSVDTPYGVDVWYGASDVDTFLSGAGSGRDRQQAQPEATA